MMRIQSVVILFFIAATSYAQNIDVLHYKFGLSLSDQNDIIQGKAVIRLKFLQSASSFFIELTTQNRNGQGMKVDSVTTDLYQPLNFSAQNDKVNIILTKPAKKNDSATFIVSYHGIPADGLIISKNRYGDRTFFSDNWPNRAHNWVPCIDNPVDKASFEFIVTAPFQYQVVSNGKLAEEKQLPGNKKLSHWIEDVPLPTKVMVIGIAKFAIKQYEDSPKNIPISAWVYPQDSTNGFKNYSTAPAIVKFYSDYIGPYPYNKLANVQSKTIFGGMENASAIFYHEESAEEDKSIEDLLAHEIAHQWFGDMATEKSFPHLWLSEGFATYLTNVYIESKYGTDSMNNRLKDERKKAVNFAKLSGKPIVDSISPVMKLLNPNSYEKGAWVLHMLRRQVGDSTFRIFIRTYYDQYKGKNADTEDLRRVAEEVTGRKLEQFFKQWLYTQGIPQLTIKWQYNEKQRSVLIKVTQQQKQVFQFPLEIKLISDQTFTITKLNITKQDETFSIPTNSVINTIYLDPNTSLLFESKAEAMNISN
ncbi:MAG TPA: M1 family metallopeptidase [Chitinophagaceae bacterium]|jgi:aminopeptidase N|nr:M1 family metallopeptidase [Chitinophagaceae bacterium]